MNTLFRVVAALAILTGVPAVAFADANPNDAIRPSVPAVPMVDAGQPIASSAAAPASAGTPATTTSGTDAAPAAAPNAAPDLNLNAPIAPLSSQFAQSDLAQASPAPDATPTPEPNRRPGMAPAPLDQIFPWQDWEGMLLGVNVDPTGYPLETFLAAHTGFGKWLDKNRLRIYGWINPGIELTNTASLGTYPISYNPIANRIELDQAVMRIERDPDTVQQDHPDWGFRIDLLYGVDYRWTTAYGWFSESSQDDNRLNAFDNPEMFYMYYLPHFWPGGSIIEVGRVISLPDVEAQLAPQNYLYSHSLMFDWDSYTQTGVFVWSKLNEQFTFDYALLFGDDIAPWNASAHFPTGQFFVKWTPNGNKDAVVAGIDAYNNQPFYYYLAQPINPSEAAICATYNGPGSTTQYTANNGTLVTGVPAGECLEGHDNLQQQNITWYHKFTDQTHNAFEAYYLWTRNAPMGGTISNGPLQYAAGGGPGTLTPGRSIAIGLVDYLESKFAKNDFASFRLDYLNDPQGWRTGYQSSYGSITLGVTHHFSTTTWLRPELRIEKDFAKGVNAYDNLEAGSGFVGTKNYQSTLGIDLIQWF